MITIKIDKRARPRRTVETMLLREVAGIAKAGGTIVYPTETLYALGVCADKNDASKRVNAIKGFGRTAPVSVALSSVADVDKYAIVDDAARHAIRNLLPGPVTLVLRNRHVLPGIPGDTIGIRVPEHPIAIQLIRFAGPLTATSANIHGGQSPRTVAASKRQLGSSVDCYVDAGRCPLGKGSTVIDLTGRSPVIIRKGAFSVRRVEAILNGGDKRTR